MLKYKTFQQFARLLLEGQTAAAVSETMPLERLFELVRPEAFHIYAADPSRTEMAGLTMRLFELWRTRLTDLADIKGGPTEAALAAISFAEWTDALHTLFWEMPRIPLLRMECVAVTVAACYMRLGRRSVVQLQRMAGLEEKYVTGCIDRRTADAVAAAARTRLLARDLCARLLEWRTERLAPAALPIQPPTAAAPPSAEAEAARIEAFLLRLDLSEDERG